MYVKKILIFRAFSERKTKGSERATLRVVSWKLLLENFSKNVKLNL